jgi:hypothetical protein
MFSLESHHACILDRIIMTTVDRLYLSFVTLTLLSISEELGQGC